MVVVLVCHLALRGAHIEINHRLLLLKPTIVVYALFLLLQVLPNLRHLILLILQLTLREVVGLSGIVDAVCILL